MQQLSSKKFQLLPLSAAVTSAFTGAHQAMAQEDSVTLEEVIVTARKRTESVQDIPSSIQAISGEDIKEMGARGMADFTRFMPSVNMISYGSGSSSVIFRGATIDGGGYVAQSTSSVYLDEISVTSTGDQPSIRMVDIQRVEALAGPQGTIYGSDAQAGTLRIITNKPNLNDFEAVIDGSLRDGSEGEMSWDGSVVLNLPIVEDTLALRVVAFGADDGGFVDNVYGRTPDTNIITGVYPAGFGTLDNAQYVDDDINDSEVTGWRATMLWQINDNWSATLGALHQETDSGSLNFYDPFVGDLEAVVFGDNWREDEYDLYSLTIEADLGFAQLVSATSYYDREVDYEIDITAYQHYWAGAYWSCSGAFDADPEVYYAYFFTPDGKALYNGAYCLGPTADSDFLSNFGEEAQQERFTQEFRLSSTGDTFDWLAGLYYEDSSNAWQDDFAGVTSNDFQDSIALAFREWETGETFPEGQVAWYSNSDTEWEQWAVFGEVVWHATDRLDVTLGGRYFDRENVNLYYVERPNTNLLPEYADGVEEHKGDETEFAPKLAISYNFTDDVMGYALYSVGYRPGGTNRSRGEPFFPNNYEGDEMTNYELGLRSTVFDGAGRFNATLFYMDWEDYQMELVDPSRQQCPEDGPSAIAGECGQPWQNIVGNAGDAHILGVTVEFDWAISQSWVFGMNAEWLEAENDTNIDLTADGTINPSDGDVAKGQELPTVADWTGSAWLSYERPVDFLGDTFYSRLQWSYYGENNNILQPTSDDGRDANPQLVNDSYDIGDLFVGFRAESWDVSLFVTNLTDERGVFTQGSGAFEWGAASVADGRAHTQKNYISRPREYGIRFIKRFGD